MLPSDTRKLVRHNISHRALRDKYPRLKSALLKSNFCLLGDQIAAVLLFVTTYTPFLYVGFLLAFGAFFLDKDVL